MTEAFIDAIIRHYPDVQAIYLFGTYGTGEEWPDSDVDIALLLPVAAAKREGSLSMSPCWSELRSLAKREVDLVNLRCVDTVFQNEILNSGRELLVPDRKAADEFAALIMSLYQKLSEERKEIIAEALRTGRAYDIRRTFSSERSPAFSGASKGRAKSTFMIHKPLRRILTVKTRPSDPP
jgi:predicted nucleotidyltransferase